METDHIVPSGESGEDDIDNAIPVCLECHAEIHCYNPKHPIGRKFSERELKKHKEQWLNICMHKPEIFAQATPISEVGPLNSLIDELEYNLEACECFATLLSTEQFNEAMRRGAISFLESDLKETIYSAYVNISHYNKIVDSYANQGFSAQSAGQPLKNEIDKFAPETKKVIEEAKDKLLNYLERDTESDLS
jgi:hypothetical protein